MVRAKITERYQGKIDYMYTPEAKSIANPENIEAIKKGNRDKIAYANKEEALFALILYHSLCFCTPDLQKLQRIV